ncbi:DUF4855 domain-containing protein [Bacillus sp. FJAT-49711]|uniref:DUF4855 domain-containing protein n=1 Tax=Bacillus sp. FJAT-49711 TaxID=2833585 RepID=UPI001BCA2087|nr:DUF4855 domain-containing protein [Bacillus sp. FJAT-49711]
MKSTHTKILIVFIVSFLCLYLKVGDAKAEYLPKDDPKSNHSSNIALIYTGYYDPANYDGERIGDFNKEKFLPYVGYLDESGKATDYFFDTFLLLNIRSPYEGSLGRYYSWVENSHPGTLKDWKWAMDRMFIKNQQLDALNQAVKEVSKTLGDQNKQVNVYLTLPFPDPQSADFGDFKGNGQSANLESLETRNELVKWYIDKMSSRFKEQEYKHLKLAGFYWFQEDLDTTVSGEKENVKYTADYLNSLDMRLGWIPWSGAGEKANGNKHGFDFTLVQPNHFFQADTTIKRIEETAKLSKANGQGIEMEFDLRAMEDPHYRKALNNYLIGGVKYGYMNDSILAYYQDVNAIYDLYHHESPIGRQFYTDIYHFSKGEYVPPTGNIDLRVIDEDGHPLSDVKISDENGLIGTTDENGKFTKQDLLSVDTTLNFSKTDYPNKSVTLDIPINETIYKDIILAVPKGENIIKTATIADFQGDFNVGGNSVVPRSFSKEKTFTGNQSLKIQFPNGWGPVRAFIDSSSDSLANSDREYVNYTNTDWSDFDTLSLAVYNDSDSEQKFVMEIMYDRYSWASSKLKNFKLLPKQWNEIEISLKELEDDGVNIKNIIRLSLAMNEFNRDWTTMYFDDIKLRKYEKMSVIPDYHISLPSKVPTMDIGSKWTPIVINKALHDEQGNPVKAANVTYESSNPNVIHVTSDGQLVALKKGKASIRAMINGIESESVVVEVSPWSINKFKGGNSNLGVGKETTLTMRNFFENGYEIPSEDAKYEWSIIKKSDVATIRDNGNNKNQQILKGVKNGKVTVQVKVTYNGQSKTFTKNIKVKNNP